MSYPETPPIERWRAAVGRTETRVERLDEAGLRRYALATGADRHGGVMPPLAHWAFFLPEPADNEIGPDGHPSRGGFMPDIDLPRRMFAASQIEFGAALTVGVPAEQTATIVSVSGKQGRSGDLVFVEVERSIRQRGEVRVHEVQTFVYRADGPPISLPEAAPAPLHGERWEPMETNLFRFSAATFNGHRIHYDLPYATQVEGYPALVVHGPFTAVKLAGLAMREGTLASFRFRALAPVFLGQPVFLRKVGDSEAEAMRCDGQIAMRAEFTFA